MDKITNYLINTLERNPEVAAKVAEPLAKHDDIRAELERWIDRQAYPQENPLMVEGYSAEMIAKLAPFMNGVGVYNFMVTLREHPDEAKAIIAKGFPIE
jgi:hypothetical protein